MPDDIHTIGTIVDLATARNRSIRDNGEKMFEIAMRLYEAGDHEYLLQIADEDGDAEFGHLIAEYIRTAVLQNACLDALMEEGSAEDTIAFLEDEIAELESARQTAVVRHIKTPARNVDDA